MTYFWINNEEIAGYSETWVEPELYPSGFALVEGLDLPIGRLFWNGAAIVQKPEQPSPEHFWNHESNAWEIVVIPIPEPLPDWQGLTSQLRGSAAWGRAYTSSERTLKANSAFTLLLTTLTSTHAVEDLVWAIAKLREAMVAIAAIGDFTTEELAGIAQALQTHGFDPGDFDLGDRQV
jgi:hypothetical protein